MAIRKKNDLTYVEPKSYFSPAMSAAMKKAKAKKQAETKKNGKKK